MPPDTAVDLHAELSVPGRRLVFCDDTDLDGKPVAALEPDIRILVAVELTSDAYDGAATEIADHLASLGMAEFHATEVANPKTKSPWKTVDKSKRIEALRWLAGLFGSLEARVAYTRIPKGQFNELKGQAQKLGAVGVDFKSGLKRVFLRCLFEELKQAVEPSLIVLDQDQSTAEPKAQHWPEGEFLVGGGPFVAQSHDVAGLQLADLAAWSIGRHLRHGKRFHEGGATPFDEVAMEVVAGFDGLRDLLGSAAAREAADVSPSEGKLH